jgi:hypothetical protein
MDDSFGILICDQLTLHVSLSNKYHTCQVELQRPKQGEKGVQKCFLSPTTMKAVFDLAPQVTALLNKLDKPGHEEQMMVEIPLEPRKALTISLFLGKPYVQLETIKNDEKQMGLAFRLSLKEWNTLLLGREMVEKTIREVKTRGNNCKTKTVHQYRWVCVKRDGSAIANVAAEWDFLEKEAHCAGEKACQDDCMMYVESRVVLQPTAETIYRAVHAYLLRQAMLAQKDKNCDVCHDPRSLEHGVLSHNCQQKWGVMAPALYAEVKDAIAPFDVATLHHSVASVLGVPPGGSGQPKSAAADPDPVRQMVMEADPQHPELEKLCRTLHVQEIKSLAPTYTQVKTYE